MHFKATALSILMLAFAPLAFADGSYTFTKTNNTVTWHASATPGFLRIDAEGGAAEGTLTAANGKVSGTLTVALDAYKTGIDMRDEHMKTKYLETTKYPTAKLVLKDQPYTEGKEGVVTGELTVKNDTKPVQITFTVTGKKVSATFKVSLKDYPSVGAPSWKLVTVADEVDVAVEGTVN